MTKIWKKKKNDNRFHGLAEMEKQKHKKGPWI